MEEMKFQESENKERPVSQTALVTTSLVAFAFLCLAVAGLYYAWRLRAQSDELVAKIDQTNASLAETRSQRDELSLKLASLTATTATSATQPAQAEGAAPATPKHATAHRRAKRPPANDTMCENG